MASLFRPRLGYVITMCMRYVLAALSFALQLGAPVCPAAPDTAVPPAKGVTFRDCPNCPEMVVIPAGKYLMGSSPQDTERDLAAVGFFESFMAKGKMASEHPQHLVQIKQPFAIGKYPVTRGQFARFVQESGYITMGCRFFDNHQYRNHPDGGWQDPGFFQTDRDPVVCVSWLDAQAYVAWLNRALRATGSSGSYRLPTEAEWEYAARAGQQSSRWWGDTIGSNNADCDGCGSAWDKKSTAPVGSFVPNQFGLYDVLGNVSEWAEDCWNGSYDGAPFDATAWKSGDCHRRVVRGGDWASSPWTLRSAERTAFDLNARDNFIGFRVMKTLP